MYKRGRRKRFLGSNPSFCETLKKRGRKARCREGEEISKESGEKVLDTNTESFAGASMLGKDSREQRYGRVMRERRKEVLERSDSTLLTGEVENIETDDRLEETERKIDGKTEEEVESNGEALVTSENVETESKDAMETVGDGMNVESKRQKRGRRECKTRPVVMENVTEKKRGRGRPRKVREIEPETVEETAMGSSKPCEGENVKDTDVEEDGAGDDKLGLTTTVELGSIETKANNENTVLVGNVDTGDIQKKDIDEETNRGNEEKDCGNKSQTSDVTKGDVLGRTREDIEVDTEVINAEEAKGRNSGVRGMKKALLGRTSRETVVKGTIETETFEGKEDTEVVKGTKIETPDIEDVQVSEEKKIEVFKEGEIEADTESLRGTEIEEELVSKIEIEDNVKEEECQTETVELTRRGKKSRLLMKKS